MSTDGPAEGARPPATSGMRHVALFVKDLKETADFYVNLLGKTVEWRPDDDNVNLTSGNDNLALHRADASPGARRTGRRFRRGVLSSSSSSSTSST